MVMAISPLYPAPVSKPGFAKLTKSSAFLSPVHDISILQDSPQKIYLQDIFWKIKKKQQQKPPKTRTTFPPSFPHRSSYTRYMTGTTGPRIAEQEQ